jgi:hypothetical protein
MLALMDMQDLRAKLQHEQSIKRDFLAPTTRLSFDIVREAVSNRFVEPQVSLRDGPALSSRWTPSRHFETQLAESLGIGVKYWDKMRTEDPELLQSNVNAWWDRHPSNRTIRTLGSTARAYLSSSFRIIDHLDSMAAVFPAIERSGMEIKGAELTASRLYLHLVSPRWQGEVKVGDPVQLGLRLTNSEIGMGALNLEVGLYVLRCTNGAIVESAIRRAHLGSRRDEELDGVHELLRDETKAADAATTLMKVRDVMDAMLTQDYFGKLLSMARESVGKKLVNPIAAVSVLKDVVDITQDEHDSVLRHLLSDGIGDTMWGLSDAVTSVANDIEDSDRRYELQKIGGQLLKLEGAPLKRLLEATSSVN